MDIKVLDIIILIMFEAALFAAAVMDIYWQQVYDFLWLMTIPVLAGFTFAKGGYSAETIFSLALYFVVQELVMKKVYGKADCHALCCCALFFAYFGLELKAFVFHLAATFILLVTMQALNKNISHELKLKKPVAMIPYILVGQWVSFIALVS